MWKCVIFCVAVVCCRDVRGDFQEQMTAVIARCCDAGSAQARESPGAACAAAREPPPAVPPAFEALCLMARAQCCEEYFTKKTACDAGVRLGLTASPCGAGNPPATTCCSECARGAAAGRAGRGACARRARPGAAAEDLLAGDAYLECCQKAKRESNPTEDSSPTTPPEKEEKEKKGDSAASLCEQFAPTELCAHHCVPAPGSFRCECNPGFMLMPDGRNCREVSRNRCRPRNPCQHKCNDNGVAVLCSCRRGYELLPDGKSCKDIDECQLDIPVCRAGAACRNVPGSYRCGPPRAASAPASSAPTGACPPGFTRNLANNACDDVNECKLPHPPCPAYACENTVGGYRCGGVSGDPANLGTSPRPAEDRCPPGFAAGPSGDCEDVDECARAGADCNPLSQHCINTHGGYFCQDRGSRLCRPGFKPHDTTGVCEDIDECLEEGLCRADQTCVNQRGQYDCKLRVDPSALKSQKCSEGMRFNPTTQKCDDVDECAEGTHLCDRHQSCLNTAGSFVCHCRPGYELDVTTGACVDVNECATGQHACIPGSQRCDNTVGSFLCVRIASCGTGYILQHATGNCEDVDECALGLHNCQRAGPEYQCLNIPGSFRCVRHRASSTAAPTTAAPEFEYVYYDEDEFENETLTDTGPSPSPVPVENPFPESSPSSGTSPGKEQEPRVEDNTIAPDPDRGDGRPEPATPAPAPVTSTQSVPKAVIPETPSPSEEPKHGLEEPNYTPEEPKSEPKSAEDNPSERQEPEKPDEVERRPEPATDAVPTYSERQPEIVYSEPERPAHRADPPGSTYYETAGPDEPLSNELVPGSSPRPGASTPRAVVLRTRPAIVRLDPRPAYSPYSPSPPTEAPPPRPVFVSVGSQTGDSPLVGAARPDGSVAVDTGRLPKNTWTRLAPPAPCPPGFEANDYGGCFDVDECVSGRHSCSGLTEACRNTVGGYLCDCARGLRRDQVSGACVLYAAVSSTTPLPPVPRAEPTPPTPPTEPPAPPTEPPTPPTEPPTPPPTPPPTTTEAPAPETTLPTTVSTTTERFWGYETWARPARPFHSRFACDAGYRRDPGTGRCEDVDECAAGAARCAAGELCVNTRGGFRCECAPRWRLDRARQRCVPGAPRGFPPGLGNQPAGAEPVEPTGEGEERAGPAAPPPAREEPEITPVEPRGAVLRCPAGYRVGDDHTCVDVDECATGEAQCGAEQLCVNQPGGYACACAPGARLAGDHRCEDVDECARAGNQSLCSHNADCVNTAGSYQCRCHQGFRAAPLNDKVCVDVDECAEARGGSLCQQRCSNVWGGYRCLCHRGYRLAADNRTCADVNECVQFKSKLPCVGTCLNEPGSYRCACPAGYRLAEDQRSCVDIDECETGAASCASGVAGGTSHVCFNTRGSYRCQRIACPPGYRLETKHRCTKTQRVCGPGDWECAHQPTTISYNFITFVSNLYVPDSNVKLFTMRGPTWPYARMKFELRLVDVNAPPSVARKADISAFLLTQADNEAVMSLVRPLEGPQSLELELSMELFSREQFGGIALAKLFIYVSEYEF